MQLIAIYVAIRRHRLARYCFRAARFFADLGARMRFDSQGPPVHAGGSIPFAFLVGRT